MTVKLLAILTFGCQSLLPPIGKPCAAQPLRPACRTIVKRVATFRETTCGPCRGCHCSGRRMFEPEIVVLQLSVKFPAKKPCRSCKGCDGKRLPLPPVPPDPVSPRAPAQERPATPLKAVIIPYAAAPAAHPWWPFGPDPPPGAASQNARLAQLSVWRN